jgi:glycine/D-amino acid oxidase-like deaminating enzyme
MSEARVREVAVVGGGVLGCSAALHLMLLGCEAVTVIERGRVGDGTSRAGAGLLARWSAGFVPAWGDEEGEFEIYGPDLYRELASRGHDLGYLATGTLFLGLAGRMGSKSLVPFRRHAGREGLALLEPDEVEDLTDGFVRAAGIAGGVLDPLGARVAAPAAARALARAFSELGGEVLEHEPVDSIRRGRTGGFVLDTATGQLKCRTLVVAAGGWTNVVLRQLGGWLPIVPLIATRAVTGRVEVPPTLPAIQFCDRHRVYLREDDGRLVWGCSYEGEPRYAFVGRDLPDRLERLPQKGVAEMMRAAQEIAWAVPAFARTTPATAAHGAPCFTADLRPMIGELGRVPGVYVLAGDNYAGVTHAPGAGRLLAELVTGVPQPSVDPHRYLPERFEGEYESEAEVVAGMRLKATQAALAAQARAS